MGPKPTDEIDAENIRSVDLGPKRESHRVKGLGLPPPTEFINTEQLLRDDREVLSQVAKEQNKVSWRAQKLLGQTSAQVKSASSALAGQSQRLLEQSSHQIKTLARQSAPRVKAAGEGIQTAGGAVWRRIRQTLDKLRAWSSRARHSARSGSAQGRLVLVEHDGALHARAEEDALASAPIAPGDHLLLYPEFEAPPGWCLAKTSAGDIGFVQRSLLCEDETP